MFDYFLQGLKQESSSPERRAEILRSASYDDLRAILSKLPPTRRPRKEYTVGGPTNRPLIRPSDEELSHSPLSPVNAWGPTWDGIMIASDWKSLLQNGFSPRNGNGKNGVLLGWTVDEGSMFNLSLSSPEALRKHFATCHPSQQDELRSLYGVDAIETDEEAAAVASAFTGDAVITTGVLSAAKGLASSQGAPPTWLYCFGLTPSLRNLQATSPLPDLIKDLMGVRHTAEIPHVFGFDGTEPHTFAQGDKYGVAADQPVQPPPSRESSFTPAELLLTKQIMSHWGAFARGETSDEKLWPQARLAAQGEASWDDFETLPVMAYGQSAQIGDPRGAVSDTVEVTTVGKLAFWDSRITKGARSVKERTTFWAKQTSWSTEYFGNPQYQEEL